MYLVSVGIKEKAMDRLVIGEVLKPQGIGVAKGGDLSIVALTNHGAEGVESTGTYAHNAESDFLFHNINSLNNNILPACTQFLIFQV